MEKSTVAVLVVILGLCSGAFGEPVAKDEWTKKAAMTRFEAGKTAYRLKDFDVAINEWREGYKLNSDPVFLFNIAQGYREKRQFTEAIDFYTSYLRERPNARNAKTVEKRIAEMKEALAQQQQAAEKPPSGPISPEGPEPPPDPPPIVDEAPSRPGAALRTSGLIVGLVGIGLGGTGIAFGVLAKADETEVNDALAAGMPWSQELDDKEKAARRKAMFGNIGMIAGGTAVVTGVILYVIGSQQGRRVEVVPQGTAGVAVRVRW